MRIPMKKVLFTFTFVMAFCMYGFSQADKMVGKWKTIDDKDGSAKSIISIFKATNGRYYGKIDKIINDIHTSCTECEGENKNKPLVGMQIINNLIVKGETLTGGTILDPKTGKIYKCNLSLGSGGNKLNVRGSLDKGGLFGRSQTWIRSK